MDEPTLGEVMRLLDATSKQLADIAAQMREDRAHAAQTYVRQDVYLAQRQADSMIVADLNGDLQRVETKVESTEEKRRGNVRWAVGVALTLAGLVIGVLAIILQGGTP